MVLQLFEYQGKLNLASASLFLVSVYFISPGLLLFNMTMKS